MLFNPYCSKRDWPAGIVQDQDQNDVPETSLTDRPRPYDERFTVDAEREFDSAMHELTVSGSVRFRVKA